MTIYTPELVQRNATFAASGAFKGLPFPTNPALRVIGCVDSRVDPSDVLGLKLGEAVVMRNVGGRVTPEALRSWALLGRLGAGQSPSGGHLAILHHTDCGIRRLASYPEQLAAFFEIPVADLGSKAVEDPYASVRIDVDIAPGRDAVWQIAISAQEAHFPVGKRGGTHLSPAREDDGRAGCA
jgi:carbonic anhydrase